MANPEHLAILKQGVKQWNKWREEHPDVRPSLSGADLRTADLDGAAFYKTNLIEAELGGAKLRGASLGKADLTGADLYGANLRDAYLIDANLTAAKLGGADLSHANLSSAKFTEADLTGADLTGANLTRATLNGAILKMADLSRTKLTGANLRSADLTEANLTEADLRSTHLADTDLRAANLRSADLTGATLEGANFNGTNLTEADFMCAYAGTTNFADVDLGTAKSLETMIHWGPSSVGIDTIYKSRGKIPEKFLRGCGVPDEFVAYIGSMVGRPIEFYSCFISYSTLDQEFAERLYNDLQGNGVRCWFAPHDIKGGRKIHEQIDEAIRLHDRLLLILSENNVNSEWVKTEIAKARKREVKEGRRVLFPVRLVEFEAMRD